MSFITLKCGNYGSVLIKTDKNETDDNVEIIEELGRDDYEIKEVALSQREEFIKSLNSTKKVDFDKIKDCVLSLVNCIGGMMDDIPDKTKPSKTKIEFGVELNNDDSKGVVSISSGKLIKDSTFKFTLEWNK